MVRFVELLCYVLWVALLIAGVRLRHRPAWEVALVVLLVCPFVVAPLEILNEVRLATTWYSPAYAIAFPGYHFPVAILVAGALYVSVLHLIASSITRGISRPWVGSAFYWLALVALSPSAVGVEALGIRLGLWAWYQPRAFTLDFMLGVWKYYACFMFGSVWLARVAVMLAGGLRQDRPR